MGITGICGIAGATGDLTVHRPQPVGVGHSGTEQPLRDRMTKGFSSPLLEAAVAGWVAYLAKSQPAFGSGWEASDQIMPLVADIARQSPGDIGAFTRLFIGNRAVFGDKLAEDADFIARVTGGARAMLEDGVAKTLGGAMAEAPSPG